MTRDEARKFKNGLYRIYWKEGGVSDAAIGRLHDGTCWFAPTNWVSKSEDGIASINWRMIDYIEHAD